MLLVLSVILLVQFHGCFSFVFLSPTRHVLRNKHEISMSARNETLRAQQRRSQSFLSPTFADANESGKEANKGLRGWIEQPRSSNSIIPTGPDSLARIEQQVCDCRATVVVFIDTDTDRFLQLSVFWPYR